VATSAYDRLSEELRQEVADELNVATIEPLSSAGADLVDHTAKGNFRALGKRFAKDTPRVAAAIAAADAGALADALKSDGTASVDLDGEPVEVLADEVIISERPREGWSVVNEQGETVALDLELTPELRRAGVAREVVRMIQEARKTGGFEVSDRIALSWHVLDQEGSDETREAIEEHRELIAREVLASTIAEADTADGLEQSDPALGLAFTVYRI
jgi:isoleucyl-tRNA synthetase